MRITGQMWEVIRERASGENKTRTRDGRRGENRGGNSSEGVAGMGAWEGRPWGTGVHAYATISFDYIIVFRPGGIIRVNKLHIFFHPIFFFLRARRPIVADSVLANSRRLFDAFSCLPLPSPPLPPPPPPPIFLARRDARSTNTCAWRLVSR